MLRLIKTKMSKYSELLADKNYSEEQLRNVDEEVSDRLGTMRFDYRALNYNITWKFDRIGWNIYKTLVENYRKNGLPNNMRTWRKAQKHALILADNLENYPDMNNPGQTMMETLKGLIVGRQIKELRLTPSFDFLFLNKDGEILFEFNAKRTRQESIMDEAHEARQEQEEESAEELEAEPERTVELVFDPFEDCSNELRAMSERVRTPGLSRFGSGINVFELIRVGRKAPHVLPRRNRRRGGKLLYLCSAQVGNILIQQFGREALAKIGYLRRGAIPNAWEIKNGLRRRGGGQVTASTLSSLRLPNYSKPRIRNFNAYADSLAGFYESADDGKPTIITAYTNGSRFLRQARNSGEYNTHSILVVGREDVQETTVREEDDDALLIDFLPKNMNSPVVGTKIHRVKPEFLKYLNVKIINPMYTITISSNGIATMRYNDGQVAEYPVENVHIKAGDKVQWQDVLVTDSVGANDRVYGLAQYASGSEGIILENLQMNLEFKEVFDFKITGYLQVGPRDDLGELLMKQVNDEKEDYRYYLAALEHIGINLRTVSERTMIPIFDIAELRERIDLLSVSEDTMIPTFDMEDVRTQIDQRGGVESFMHYSRRGKIMEFNEKYHNMDEFNPAEESFEDYYAEHVKGGMVMVKWGESPWGLVKDEFEQFFPNTPLDLSEIQSILTAVDGWNDSIDLRQFLVTEGEEKVRHFAKFERGSIIFLPADKVLEVVRYIRSQRVELFGPADYKHIIQPDEVQKLPEIVGRWFDKEAGNMGADLKFANLDNLQRQYVFKAMQASNPVTKGIDLNFRQNSHRPIRIRPGYRIFLRKVDLQHCINQFLEYEKASEMKTEIFTDGYETSENIKQAIDSIYCGSMENAVLGKLLEIVHWNEIGRNPDSNRARAKQNTSTQSVGYYQLRLTFSDINSDKTQGLLRAHGQGPLLEQILELRKNGNKLHALQLFRNALEKNPVFSTIVAGERLRRNIHKVYRMMEENGEIFRPEELLYRKDFAVMVLQMYHRTPSAMGRTICQNWAIKLADAAGINPSVKREEYDAASHLKWWVRRRFSYNLTSQGAIHRAEGKVVVEHIIETLLKVAYEVNSQGELDFQGNIRMELDSLIDGDGSLDQAKFFNSPLIAALRKWYSAENAGDYLSMVVNLRQSRERMNMGIYAYGTRFFRKQRVSWRSFFENKEAMEEQISILEGEYEPALELPPLELPPLEPLDIDADFEKYVNNPLVVAEEDRNNNHRNRRN
jgi:hypothetical protein